MTTFAPPTVVGPVFTSSPVVRVDGVLEGTTVQVSAQDGTPHADGTAGGNGSVWLTVTNGLQEGSVLVATQSDGVDSSLPSVHGTPVLAPPPDLPRPVFEAVLNQCSEAVLLSGLVPGADVTISRSGTGLVAETAHRTRQWIRLGTSIGVGETLSAQQTLAGVNPSPTAWSDPVTRVDLETGVGVPHVVGPLTACRFELEFAGVVPTASVIVEFDDGSWVSWYAPDTSFRGSLAQRLTEGSLRVRQLLPTCERESEDGHADVGPEQPPPKPEPHSFCPEVRRIEVDGLVRGARVDFTTASWDNAIGGWGPETPLMVAGATGGRQEFDLPRVVGGGPGPIVNIFVRQTLCTMPSEFGFKREFIRPGEAGGVAPSAHPQIVGPVYACAQTVRVDPSGWGLGVLRSSVTGRQLADAFAPNGWLPVVLPLWAPLDAGDEILVEYTGCDPPPPTTPRPVLAVPNPMPDLTIVTPLPGDSDLVVSGALPGATVVALVDHSIRVARTTSDGNATLPLGAPLADGQRVWAFQRLCGARGNDENYVVVRRGSLTASCAPSTVTAGAPATLTVSAVRTDTGAAVGGLPVSLAGVGVGVTGSPFAWSPGAAGSVSGVVRGAPRYADAGFTLTVKAPPPPPTGSTLTLQMGGIGGYGSPISITQIAWRVQPSWAAGPVSGSGATATVVLPPPPAGTPSPRASVFLETLVGTRADGGAVYTLSPDALAPMTIVALTKPALHVGFLLTTELRAVLDDGGNVVAYIWVALVRWMGTT